MGENKSGRRAVLLGALMAVFLVGAVFWPILGFNFVNYDVETQLLTNPHITGLSVENLKYILTSPCITSYYPARSFSFLVDYEIWGLNPFGFKLTNLLIHLGNALLLYWLLLRIFRGAGDSRSLHKRDAAVAAFTSCVFAIHPVVVEPVAWVAGREELMMLLGALGCFHFHLSARRLEEEGKRGRAVACLIGAALCCAMACLSNAVGAVIPAIITAWDLLTLPRPRLGKLFRGTSALWLIGLAAILIKKATYTGELLNVELPLVSFGRLLLALRVYWLNLTSLIWPTGLTIRYGWHIPKTVGEMEVILGALALGVTCLTLWKVRSHKLVLFGLLWFGLALAPVSQIVPHHVHRADRFLYLPLVGLLLALALSLRPVVQAAKGRVQLLATISACVGCLLALDVLSAAQVQTWRSDLLLWQHAVEVTEDNALAQRALADHLADAGLFEQAIPHYREAIRIDPNDPHTLNNYAVRLATCNDRKLRDYKLAVELAAWCRRLEHGKDLVFRQGRLRIYASYAEELASQGDLQKALQFYQKALEEATQMACDVDTAGLVKELQRRIEVCRKGKD